jgi:hypothetical protein
MNHLFQLRCIDQAGHDPVRCDASSSQRLRQAEGHVVERGLGGQAAILHRKMVSADEVNALIEQATRLVVGYLKG